MPSPSSLLPSPPARFALLGGTFDPPHLAHLVAAQCALHQFGLEKVTFLPAGDPWRKTGGRDKGGGMRDKEGKREKGDARSREQQPSAEGTAPWAGEADSSLIPHPSSLSARRVSAAAHRLEMTRLAIEGNDAFALDDRETRRPGPTYTVDTLEELHRELLSRVAAGPHPSSPIPPPSAAGTHPSSLIPHPYLILGTDALADLPNWKSPERIPQLAQIIIAPRAGFDPDSCPYPVIDMPPLGISSTLIRQRVAEGKPIRYLVPPAVEAYIHAHRLYR